MAPVPLEADMPAPEVGIAIGECCLKCKEVEVGRLRGFENLERRPDRDEGLLRPPPDQM